MKRYQFNHLLMIAPLGLALACGQSAQKENIYGGVSLAAGGGGGTVCGNAVCEEGETYVDCSQDCKEDLLIVVESSQMSGIATNLGSYVTKLEQEGYGVRVESFSLPATVQELKSVLEESKDVNGISGVWLIGNLPAAWYEQDVTWVSSIGPEHEEFPCDLYLMDLNGNWQDSDNDGIYDDRNLMSLTLEVFTSRLMGTSTQINAYLARALDYRTNGSLVDKSAYIFRDDDWASIESGEDWNLDGIYDTIDLVEADNLTTSEEFRTKLKYEGAEFVYHWVHAQPDYLDINGIGSGYITTDVIANNDFQGSFYNMFSCFASRFTEPETVGMTYLTDTTAGLAVVGSTKLGGMNYPDQFHLALNDGDTWGEAFAEWYHAHGASSDKWYLGLVLFGDPLLTISPEGQGGQAGDPPSEEEEEELSEVLAAGNGSVITGTFEDYQDDHPEFF